MTQARAGASWGCWREGQQGEGLGAKGEGGEKPWGLPRPHANLVRVLKSFFSITSFLKITNSALMEIRLNFPVGLEMRSPVIV